MVLSESGYLLDSIILAGEWKPIAAITLPVFEKRRGVINSHHWYSIGSRDLVLFIFNCPVAWYFQEDREDLKAECAETIKSFQEKHKQKSAVEITIVPHTWEFLKSCRDVQRCGNVSVLLPKDVYNKKMESTDIHTRKLEEKKNNRIPRSIFSEKKTDQQQQKDHS